MSSTEMHLYVVGQPYNPNVTSWPEKYEYNYRQGEHELLIFLKSPRQEEIEAATTGTAEFALHVEGSALFLMTRFGEIDGGKGLPWSDAPYSWWFVRPDQRRIPDAETAGRHLLLPINLVDADTGILRGMRATTLSPDFTVKLIDAIRRQARSSFDPTTHQKDIERAYRKYPTVEAMVDAAAARCIGGD
jgi:hypothetical protein